MQTLLRTIEKLSVRAGHAGALLVAVLIVLMNYEVLARYLFGAPTIWSFEVSTMVMGASFLLALAYGVRTDSNVRIDLLAPLLGRRGRPLVDLVGYGLVMLPLLVWLSWTTWHYFYAAWASGETSGQSAWNPKVWPFRLVMLAGVALWTLQVAAEALARLLELLGRAGARDAQGRGP